MSSPSLLDLLSQSPFSFVGTVEHLGAATMGNIQIDDHTAVVRVDYVLRAPQAVTGLERQRITVQLLDNMDLPAAGSAYTFFAEGLAFGESLAVRETARLPADAAQPYMMGVLAAGPAATMNALESQIATQQMRAHAESASAVVLGRVAGLQRVSGQPAREHNPDWWIATIDVYAVEKGDVALGPVNVLYANSQDVQWRDAPKPRASQGGMWLFHATEGSQRELAPFMIIHPEDYQPTQSLDDVRGGG